DIVVIGYNSDDSIEKTEELKFKLTNSQLIYDLYGDIKTKWWSKEEFVVKIAGRYIKIHPRGSGQPVRGRIYHDERPGLILIDDLEKSKEVENPEIRREKKDWLYSDVLNCIDRRKKHTPGEDAPWEFLIMGTILHQDSLLINLHESDNWDSTLLEVCDDNFRSNVPHLLNDVECRALYKELKNDNQVDTWYREYRNLPVAKGEDAAFPDKFFLHYKEEDEKISRNHRVENVIIVDPSRTATATAAPTGIVAVGVDMDKNKIYVRDCISRRVYPEEMYQIIADTIRWTGARVLAVEVTGLHEFIIHPLKTFLRRLGIQVEFVSLQARHGKDERGKAARVRSLVDFYRQGIIWHNEKTCEALEQQLGAFPKAKDWSLMDPLGYIVE
ncbi:hypothetical protein LCGC14_2906570, partial [marine sediment metagenome]